MSSSQIDFSGDSSNLSRKVFRNYARLYRFRQRERLNAAKGAHAARKLGDVAALRIFAARFNQARCDAVAAELAAVNYAKRLGRCRILHRQARERGAW